MFSQRQKQSFEFDFLNLENMSESKIPNVVE